MGVWGIKGPCSNSGKLFKCPQTPKMCQSLGRSIEERLRNVFFNSAQWTTQCSKYFDNVSAVLYVCWQVVCKTRLILVLNLEIDIFYTYEELLFCGHFLVTRDTFPSEKSYTSPFKILPVFGTLFLGGKLQTPHNTQQKGFKFMYAWKS